MMRDPQKGVAVIQQQLKELDGIFQETMGTLNTVSGMERVAKWRAKTVTALTEVIGEKAGQDFARIQPGPSFSNDLVEEFTDLIDCFRVPLTTLFKTLTAQGPTSGG
jgi:hypothetical protein